MELKAIKSKEERVATLAPLYKLGYIYHNKDCCQKLESQLLEIEAVRLFISACGAVKKKADSAGYGLYSYCVRHCRRVI